MVIKDIKTGKDFYSTGGDKTYFIVSEFWKALKASKIKYRSGGQKTERDSIVCYSTRETLSLKNKNFEKTFKGIARSEIGRLVMSGQLPATTIM